MEMEKQIICSKCGFKNRSSANFCSNCGAELTRESIVFLIAFLSFIVLSIFFRNAFLFLIGTIFFIIGYTKYSNNIMYKIIKYIIIFSLFIGILLFAIILYFV